MSLLSSPLTTLEGGGWDNSGGEVVTLVVDGRGWGSLLLLLLDDTGRWLSCWSLTLGVGAVIVIGRRWWGVGRRWLWWGGCHVGRRCLMTLEGGGWDDDGGGGGSGVVALLMLGVGQWSLSLSSPPPSDDVGGGVVVTLSTVGAGTTVVVIITI